MTAKELRALAVRENRKADKARGQEVENVAMESYHRGKAHAYGHIAYLLNPKEN